MDTKEILKLAKKNNLCKEWQEKMKSDLSLQNLCKMYFDGDDWAIERDFPSLAVLKQFIGESEKYGLFTDYAGELENVKQSAFFGKSKAVYTSSGFHVGNLIARHESKINIKAAGNSILFITILDNAEIEIECTENASITVFNKAKRTIKSSGNVIVK